MSGVTLAGFLLARYLEEEALHVVLLVEAKDDATFEGIRTAAADLDAKRRIVRPWPGDEWSEIVRHDPTAHRVVLELLALPYCDHPDYRQEWAP